MSAVEMPSCEELTERIAVLEDAVLEAEELRKALKLSEEKYRDLVETATDIIYLTDIQGRFTFFNPAALKVTGHSAEKLIGMHFTEIIHPDFREEAEQFYRRQLAERVAETYKELPVLARDKREKWLGQNVQLVTNNGRIEGFHSISRDITERKQMEQALRESERNYRVLADKIPDIVWITSLDLMTVYVSPSVETLLGFTQEERMLQDVTEQLTPESLVVATEALTRQLALEGDTTADPERKGSVLLEYYHKDGSTRWMETTVSGVRDDMGMLTGLHGINRDVTERKRAEEDLHRTLESLRKSVGTTIRVMVNAVEARDPYTAGHQIRTADLARAIGTEMGLTADAIDGLRMAGSIHDIGKLYIPSEILSKPSRLSDLEFSLIREHAQRGCEMLKGVESPWPLAEIVHQHHERMDGSGYPQGLKGDEIICEARIIAVADVVEAMASHRPYRPSLGLEAALQEIEERRGVVYDSAVADACLTLFREKGFQLAKG